LLRRFRDTKNTASKILLTNPLFYEARPAPTSKLPP
jgi:hypothetical protein